MKFYLTELFCSIQGEGSYLGERQIFVRFCDCHRSCIFCDTPLERIEQMQLERVPGSGVFEGILNPLSTEQLMDLISELDGGHHFPISITGGEPLLWADELQVLLPQLSAHRIYLETAGDLTPELKKVIDGVDVVAMDVKLESVTHEKSTLRAHGDFLRICRTRGVEVFVKLVLSAETDVAELMRAVAEIKAAGGADTAVILQPMSASEKIAAVPSARQLLDWQAQVAAVLPQVRVIPQTHKMMGVL